MHSANLFGYDGSSDLDEAFAPSRSLTFERVRSRFVMHERGRILHFTAPAIASRQDCGTMVDHEQAKGYCGLDWYCPLRRLSGWCAVVFFLNTAAPLTAIQDDGGLHHRGSYLRSYLVLSDI